MSKIGRVRPLITGEPILTMTFWTSNAISTICRGYSVLSWTTALTRRPRLSKSMCWSIASKSWTLNALPTRSKWSGRSTASSIMRPCWKSNATMKSARPMIAGTCPRTGHDDPALSGSYFWLIVTKLKIFFSFRLLGLSLIPLAKYIE